MKIDLSNILQKANVKWRSEVANQFQYFKDGDLVIIRYQPASSSKPFHFAYWLRNVVAEGGFGILYRTYLLNDKNQIDTDREDYVAKIQSHPEDYHFQGPAQDKEFESTKNEANFLNKKSITTLPGFDTPDGYAIITKNIKGIDLFNDRGIMPSIIASLSYTQRLELMTAIAISFNLVHHTTPSSGESVFHRDLKGANIRIGFRLRKKGAKDYLIEFNKNQIIPNDIYFTVDDANRIIPSAGYRLILDVYPIDFGLSEKINPTDQSDMNTTLLNMTKAVGTPHIVPTEVLLNMGGLKTDVYALTPIFIRLLGGRSPFSLKEGYNIRTAEGILATTKEKYNLNGIDEDIPNVEIANINVKPRLLKELTNFLNLMQHREYNKRPDMDAVLRFLQVYMLFFKEYQFLKGLRHYLHLQQVEHQDFSGTRYQIDIQESQLNAYLKELKTLSEGTLFQPYASEEPRVDKLRELEDQRSVDATIETTSSRLEKASLLIKKIQVLKEEKFPILLEQFYSHSEISQDHLVKTLNAIISELEKNIHHREGVFFSLQIKMNIKNPALSEQRDRIAKKLKTSLEEIKLTLQNHPETPERVFITQQQTINILTMALKANENIYKLFRRSVDKTGRLDALIKNSLNNIENLTSKAFFCP